LSEGLRVVGRRWEVLTQPLCAGQMNMMLARIFALASGAGEVRGARLDAA
jgi:hypothetical protein